MPGERPNTDGRGTGPDTRLTYRHTLPVRFIHWFTVLCLYILLLSGFQIFNAHPNLYWGARSDFDSPLVSIGSRVARDGDLIGVTTVFGYPFETTGFLGVSANARGVPVRRAFPAWLTIPSAQWLAMGRRWHFFFAWALVFTGLIYVAYSVWSRHIVCDLAPNRADWRGLGRSIVDHLRLRHPRGEAASRYNVLQKLTYLVVIFVLLPVMVLTGLAMSPRIVAEYHWLLVLFDGRQSARTIHFFTALALVAFTLVHVIEAVVTGPWNNLRSMITGRYRIVATKGSRDDKP